MKILRMNNKGYAMTEALIVSTVVLTALVLIYMQFTKLNSAYGEQYYYNNVNGIYALNQISSYISNEDNGNLVTDLSTYIDITSCNPRYFSNENYCKMVMSAANIDYIFFTYNNKKVLINALKVNNPYDMRLQSFVKTINDTDDSYNYMLVAKFKEGYYASIPYIANAEPEPIAVGTTWTFDYNGTDGTDGTAQIFIVPETGNYKLETWGAQGGNNGGYGSYSEGVINLIKDNTIYIVAGGAGLGDNTHQYRTGGYNGGGDATTDSDSNTRQASGGGATHIATSSGLLSTFENKQNELLIVSGGGGGNGTNVAGPMNNKGHAGGYIGVGSSDNYTVTGGTQTAGGSCGGAQSTHCQDGSFGQGGGAAYAGGGGGYYGGANYCQANSGGSGYIGNSLLTNKKMVCYNCETNNDTSTKTETTTCTNATPTAECAKQGNGYAKITYLGPIEPNTEFTFDYRGSVEMFTVPETGTYKLELWGAQGGSITNTNGGAYTAGEIVLNKDSNLYIYVGEQGNNTRNTAFNGGGKGGATNSSDETFKGSSGGGATDIRLVGGNWDDTASLKSRIMVAAGSGGGTDEVYERAGENSIAGGLTGGTGGYYNGHSYVNQNGKGGTQTAGGAAGNNHFSATGTNNAGTFGVGGNCDSTSDNKGAGGGGGGYFGGGAGGSTLSGGSGQGGGGGSSYISGHTGCVAIASVETITPKVGCTNGTTDITCSYHYSGKRFTNTVMKSGNESMPTHDGTGTMTGNTGNGYAKITYLGN